MAVVGFGSTTLGTVSGTTYRIDRSKMSSSRIREVENQYRQAQSMAETRRQEAQVAQSIAEAAKRNAEYEARLETRTDSPNTITRVSNPSPTGAVSSTFQAAVERSTKPVEQRRYEREMLAQQRKIDAESRRIAEQERSNAISELFPAYTGPLAQNTIKTIRNTGGQPPRDKAAMDKSNIVLLKGDPNVYFKNPPGQMSRAEFMKLQPNAAITPSGILPKGTQKAYAMNEYRVQSVSKIDKYDQKEGMGTVWNLTPYGGGMSDQRTPESALKLGFSRLFERNLDRQINQGKYVTPPMPAPVVAEKKIPKILIQGAYMAGETVLTPNRYSEQYNIPAPAIKGTSLASSMVRSTIIDAPKGQALAVGPEIIKKQNYTTGTTLPNEKVESQSSLGKVIIEKAKDSGKDAGIFGPLTSSEMYEAGSLIGLETISGALGGLAKGMRKGEVLKAGGRAILGGGVSAIKGTVGGAALIVGERVIAPIAGFESRLVQGAYDYGKDIYKSYAPERLQKNMPSYTGRVTKEAITGPFGPVLAPVNVGLLEAGRLTRRAILSLPEGIKMGESGYPELIPGRFSDEKIIMEVEERFNSPKNIESRRVIVSKEIGGLVSSGVGLYAAEKVINRGLSFVGSTISKAPSIVEPMLKGEILTQKVSSARGKEVLINSINAVQKGGKSLQTSLNLNNLKGLKLRVNVQEPSTRILSTSLSSEGTKNTVYGIGKDVFSKKNVVSFNEIRTIKAGEIKGFGSDLVKKVTSSMGKFKASNKRVYPMFEGVGNSLKSIKSSQITDSFVSEMGRNTQRTVVDRITPILKTGQDVKSKSITTIKKGVDSFTSIMESKTKIMSEDIVPQFFKKTSGKTLPKTSLSASKGILMSNNQKYLYETISPGKKISQNKLVLTAQEGKAYIEMQARVIGQDRYKLVGNQLDYTVGSGDKGVLKTNKLFEITGKSVEGKKTTPFNFVQNVLESTKQMSRKTPRQFKFMDYTTKAIDSTKISSPKTPNGLPYYSQSKDLFGVKQVFPDSRLSSGQKLMLKTKEKYALVTDNAKEFMKTNVVDSIARVIKKPKPIIKKSSVISGSIFPKFIPFSGSDDYGGEMIYDADNRYPPASKFSGGPSFAGSELGFKNIQNRRSSTGKKFIGFGNFRTRSQQGIRFDLGQETKTPQKQVIETVNRQINDNNQVYENRIRTDTAPKLGTQTFYGTDYSFSMVTTPPKPPKPVNIFNPFPTTAKKASGYRFPPLINFPRSEGRNSSFSFGLNFRRTFRPSKVSSGDETLDFVFGTSKKKKRKSKKGRRRVKK